MDLRDFIRLAKRWAWLLVASAAVAGGFAYALHSTLTPPASYQATASVLVGPGLSPNADPGRMEAARRISLIYTQLATSRPVLERTRDTLDLDLAVEDLRGLVVATTTGEPPIVTVSAVAADRALAAAIANEVVDQLIAQSPSFGTDEEATQEFIQRQAETIQQEITTLIPEIERLSGLTSRTTEQDERLTELRARLTTLQTTYAALVSASSPAAANLLTVLENATEASAQGLPTGRLQVTLLAALLGLIVAGIAAFMAEKLDDTIKSASDIRRTTGFRNLGEIMRIPRSAMSVGAPASVLAGPGPLRESFRTLRTSIDFANPDPMRSLLVTSAVRREGRTTVAANLAVAYAEAGKQVLLVDADLRQPALHNQFGLSNQHGLIDLLRSPDAALATVEQRTEIRGLNLLAAGIPPVAAGETAGSAQMKDLIIRLTDSPADLVILDSPTMLGAAETAVLASLVDGTVLVVAAGRTSLGSLQAARDTLVRARARVLGTVVNRVPGRGEPDAPRTHLAPPEAATVLLGDDRTYR